MRAETTAGMTDRRFARFESLLRGAERNDRARRLQGRAGHDFSSNDYLGLAASPVLAAAMQDAAGRGVPVGAGGSRLLRGNHPEHEALEDEAARFFGAGRCLFFGSGYAANLAILSALPARADLVVHDALVHASAHEGMQAGRAACVPFRHNDAAAAEDAIRAWRARGGRGTPWIVAESLYSMDGDTAPLDALLAIAERHDGFLVIDEAHATGVAGEGGRGLAAAFEGRAALVSLHTCGKALGASGALVAADARLIDMLVNRARPFIYATAPSPLIAAAVRAALRLLAAEPERRHALAARAALAGTTLQARLGVAGTGTQIIPVMLGGSARALRVAARMQMAGFDCRAIRPPTVPDGTARLRLSITLNVDDAAILAMVDALADTLDAVA